MGWGNPLTHRQFETLVCWQEMQWNEPNRTDHYIMQATAVHTKQRSLNAFRIPFKHTAPSGKSVDKNAPKVSMALVAASGKGITNQGYTLRRETPDGELISVETIPANLA